MAACSRKVVLLASLALLGAGRAAADSAVIGASRDNTLYTDGTGGLSNGAGEYFFAGQAGSARRGLVAFDVAAAIPAGSTIQSATLTLHCSRLPSGGTPISVELHRVTTAWGEGASNAGDPGGTGTAAEPGDATWIHTFFPSALWTTPGGDFNAAASAAQSVAGVGLYVWASTPALVADVQGWLDNPAGSNGWIVIGPEGGLSNARRFDTRENQTPEFRPVLRIEYATGQVGVEPAAFSVVKALYR